MIIYGGGFVSKEHAIQSIYCSKCGKHLGNQGWSGDHKFNDVENKKWEYCPYCGEVLNQ